MTVASNHKFTTSDTALATYLIVDGHKLILIDYTQPRYEFVFQDTDEIHQNALKYITGKTQVDANTLIRINKKLLRLVKNQMQWVDEE